MAQPIDILDERERLGGPAFFSIFLHIGIVVFVVGWGLYSKRMEERFGEPNASAGIAVAVTPVNSIPIPRRQGPENPVANDTESVVPTPVQKQETAEKPPDKAAIEIPDQQKPKKPEKQERLKQTYTQ